VKINLKHSKSRWIDIDGETQFLIDYPTIEQKDEIDLFLSEIMYMDDAIMGMVDKKEVMDRLSSFPAKKKAYITQLNTKVSRLAMKYQIKGWKGITNGTGKPVKLKLVSWVNSNGEEDGTQIDEGQFKDLVRDLQWWDLMHIYNCFTQETEFTEVDKKKL
jgi:hypothetical protein